MTKPNDRKEYTFLEAMELVKAGEIVESYVNYYYKIIGKSLSCKHKEGLKWATDKFRLTSKEIQNPWYKVEKEKPKKTITIYEHGYWSHDSKEYFQMQTKKKWKELHNTNSGSYEHLSTKVLKTIKVEDRRGEG